MKAADEGILAMPPLWAGRLLFTAWGFAKGTLGPEVFTRARRAGFTAIALQAGQHGADQRRQAVDAGLQPVLWGLAPFEIDLGYAGVIVQVEDDGQRKAALAMLEKVGPYDVQRPAAIVTTFGGSDRPELVEPFMAYAPAAFVECYVEDDPIHADLPRMLDQAGRYGWPLAIPVIGLYHGRGLDAYPALKPVGGFAVWVAEEMAESDWDDLGRFG